MKTLDKWAERIYAETDFGRSIATSVAGIVGLSIYLASSDWVIAAFSSVIVFPIVRLIASEIRVRIVRRAQGRIDREEAERIYDRLSENEKKVVRAFVQAGGSVLTWGQVNQLSLPATGVESLIQREMLWTSMTADGMRETFVLDSSVFDVGQARSSESNVL